MIIFSSSFSQHQNFEKPVAAAAMAQNQNSSKSEAVCKKFYKTFSFQTTKTPANQPTSTRPIPIEFGHTTAHVSGHKNKNVTFFSPKILSKKKEQHSTNEPCPDNAKREVGVVNEQGNDKKAAKSASRQELALPRGHVENDAVKESKPSVHVSAAKTKSLKDDGKFSDYIRKVKGKMRTVSNIGAGKSAGKSATRRDSFNDKVSHYINRAKIKIRTTTMVGNDKGDSVK